MARLLSETIFGSWPDYPKTTGATQDSLACSRRKCKHRAGCDALQRVEWRRPTVLLSHGYESNSSRLPARGPAPAGRRSTIPRHHGCACRAAWIAARRRPSSSARRWACCQRRRVHPPTWRSSTSATDRPSLPDTSRA